MRRLFHRQTSKDDMSIKKSLHTPTSIEAIVKNGDKGAGSGVAGSRRVPRKSSCDFHLDSHSNRADRFKVQFVQVYVGIQVFVGANIEAVVVINLQASDRLYEIVLIDKKKMTEIVRFYVLEDELQSQMNRRYEAVMKLYRRRPTLTVDTGSTESILPPLNSQDTCTSSNRSTGSRSSQDISPRPLSSGGSSGKHSFPCSPSFGDSKLPAKSGLQKSANAPGPLFCKHPKPLSIDNDDAPLSPSNELSPRRKSGTSMRRERGQSPQSPSGLKAIPSFKKEIAHDPIRRHKLVPGLNKTGSGNNLLGKLTKEEVLQKRDVALQDPEFARRKSLSGVRTIIENDISVASQKDIGYYTSVILHSLYCSLKRVDVGFRLFEEISGSFFKIFNTIPSEIKNTVATFINCKKIVEIEIAVRRYDIHEDNKTDSAEAKELLDTADLLSHQLDVEEAFGTRKFMQDDSLNPNRKRYRLLWQSAYAAIVATIRQNRGVRTEWTKLMSVARSTKEREDFMKQHAKDGKFRKHATSGSYLQPGNITVDDIKVYRDDFNKRQSKGKDKKRTKQHVASALLY